MAESSPPENPALARFQLLLLMLLPIMVVALATIVFYTGIGMPDGTRNKGVLIAPPQQINELVLKDIAGQPVRIAGEKDQLWTFVVVHPSLCDDGCLRQLWEIRQTHVALGKFQGHIRRVWLVTGGAPDQQTMHRLEQDQPGWSIVTADGSEWRRLLVQSGGDRQQIENARFYLVDPRGFLMMYYTDQDTYKDVMTDMKFLLKGVQ